MHKKLSLGWFLLGLGGEMQILASLSFTELFCLIAGPIWLFSDVKLLRKHGVMTFVGVSFFLVVGCVAASLWNETPFQFAYRGLATCVIVFFAVVVAHHMINQDPAGFKWAVVGGTLSIILCTFIFQKSVEVAIQGETVDEIMSGPLFWIQRLGAFLTVPTRGWYLQTPLPYAVFSSVFMAVFSVMTTDSGRSASLAALGSVAMILIGRKKIRTIIKISMWFWPLMAIAVVSLLLINGAYRIAATSGSLGEKARLKYEHQTKGGTGIGRLLLGGRMESFVGLLAVRDSPIFGKGPWPLDTEDYTGEFLMKYGDAEDYVEYEKAVRYILATGRSVRWLPCHSHITMFWVWFGLPGFIFWLYVLYCIYRFLRKDIWVVPQWFGWIGIGLPGTLWHIFFSPFHARVGISMMVVAMLMARAYRLGKAVMPIQMQEEILRNEGR